MLALKIALFLVCMSRRLWLKSAENLNPNGFRKTESFPAVGIHFGSVGIREYIHASA